jgi:hypothetical protein
MTWRYGEMPANQWKDGGVALPYPRAHEGTLAAKTPPAPKSPTPVDDHLDDRPDVIDGEFNHQW